MSLPTPMRVALHFARRIKTPTHTPSLMPVSLSTSLAPTLSPSPTFSPTLSPSPTPSPSPFTASRGARGAGRASGGLVLLSVLALFFGEGCRKHRVDPLQEVDDDIADRTSSSLPRRWDPPTAAFGFHAVSQAECLRADAGRFRTATNATPEEIAVRHRPIRSIATDYAVSNNSGGRGNVGGNSNNGNGGNGGNGDGNGGNGDGNGDGNGGNGNGGEVGSVKLREGEVLVTSDVRSIRGGAAGGAIYFTESDPLDVRPGGSAATTAATRDTRGLADGVARGEAAAWQPPLGSVHVALPISPSPIAKRQPQLQLQLQLPPSADDHGSARWRVLDIATNESDPSEIALTPRRVYWVARNKSTPSAFDIRFAERGSSIVRSALGSNAPIILQSAEHAAGADVHTLATETSFPSRLISSGRHVFWIAGDHIRQITDDDPKGVRSLYKGSLLPGHLAATDEALFAFTNDRTLLRIPLEGGSTAKSGVTVLVSTTATAPRDLIVNSGWVYWIEEGEAMERCNSKGGFPCHHGYQRTDPPLPHPRGSLRRVPVHGGAVEDVATNLLDATSVTFLDPRSPWLTQSISAAAGPVRLSLSGRFEDHAELTTELNGFPIHPTTRLAPHGPSALVMATHDQATIPGTSRLVRLHSF